MHDCKSSGLTMAALAANEIPSAKENDLLAELQACPNCREELASIRNAVCLADDAFRAVAPTEDFWVGYHQRLEQRLLADINNHKDSSYQGVWWLGPLTSSVRVPTPLAIVVVLLFAGTSAFSVSQYLREVAPPSPPISQSVEPTIVPLVREQVVTRVVYVTRNTQRRSPAVRNVEAELAPTDRTVAGISGFKPTTEVKLTIIKGSTVDEK